MKHFLNFIKFAVIIAILEFTYVFILLNYTFISYKADRILLQSLILIFLVFIAFKKKYVMFQKNNWKQNFISIIFIICSAMWFAFILRFSIRLLVGMILYYFD